MSLTRLLHELDKLTQAEKLQAIQYLASSLDQKSDPVSQSDPRLSSLSQAAIPKDQATTENPPEQPAPKSEAIQQTSSKKKSATQRKTYSTAKISEMSADGKLIEVEIPGWEMVQDFARNVCEALAEETNDPSIANHETVAGLADFIRVAARIQAKAMIRKQLTGTNIQKTPPPPKRKVNARRTIC